MDFHPTSTLTKNNFIGNIANNGGALFYYNSTGEIHFNRIVENIALTRGSALYAYNQTVNAINNWWGNNSNPITVPNLIYVDGCSLDTDPWVILTVKANNLNYSIPTAFICWFPLPGVSGGDSSIVMGVRRNYYHSVLTPK